jgi:16S rRNA C1402 (ribose-2'-O) methylase RsmI
MMLYVLIGLSLSLAGLAGLQFFYLVYLERMGKEYKKRIHELENHNKYLSHRLADAEQQITDQTALLEVFYEELEDEEEVWADVIDER